MNKQSNPTGNLKLKPTMVSLTIHNPKEIADIRTKSFQIPLGSSTIVYITPKAREIDKSGMELSETQRKCRLNDETRSLDIFNLYTRTSCLFECKMKYALKNCGCQPWNYPLNINDKVRECS